MSDKLYIIKSTFNVIRDFAKDIEDDFKEKGNSVHQAFTPSTEAELKRDFDAIIKDVNTNVVSPMLHLDFHGDTQCFQFEAAETMGWDVLAKELEKLNMVANGKLVVTMSICHGASIIAECQKLEKQPFQILIASDENILGRNAYWRMKAFYEKWIETHNATVAFEAFDRVQTGAPNNFVMYC